MNKLFKPRYKVVCLQCKRHPVGQWDKYDLYWCKPSPGDRWNAMIYDKDHEEGHCYTILEWVVVESRPVMYLMFTFYILNNLGDSCGIY